MTYIDDPQTQKSNAAYIRKAMDAPYLEKEHELSLARKWRDNGDEQALHALIQAYTRLVVSAAMKFKHYGLPTGDLIQEGNIGLMEAAKRFDPNRDLRFSTYAAWWIRASIQDYVLRNWSIVRTGSTSAQKTLFFNLRRLRARIESRNEAEGLNEEGRAEIAEALKVRVSDVETMEKRLSGADQSLNATISDDGEQDWQSLLVDSAPNPEDVVTEMKDAQARSAWLGQAIGGLDAREQTIIKKRHLGDDVVTLEVLGDQLGISKERVRQIEKRAMEKMKSSIENITDGNYQSLL